MPIVEWNGTFLRGVNVAEYTAGRDKLIADGIIQFTSGACSSCGLRRVLTAICREPIRRRKFRSAVQLQSCVASWSILF
jgi:hypothetical protein